jgi:hypothetical protein
MKITNQSCAFALELMAATYLIASSCISKEMIQNVLPPFILKTGISIIYSFTAHVTLFFTAIIHTS